LEIFKTLLAAIALSKAGKARPENRRSSIDVSAAGTCGEILARRLFGTTIPSPRHVFLKK